MRFGGSLSLALLVLTTMCFASGDAASMVRLTEGPDVHEGILQYSPPGSEGWVDVCGDAIQQVDADVACRELGFHGADVIENVTRFEAGTTYNVLNNVWCEPEQNSFKECEMTGVLLNDTAPCDGKAPNITCLTTRLYGGSDMAEGRVEVWYEGSWGKVCSQDFDDDEQDVVCRELGYERRSEIDFDTNQFSDPQNLAYVWGGVTCSGSEAKLADCSRDSSAPSSCPDGGDVHASCTNSEEDRDAPPFFAVKLEDGLCETEGRLMVYGGSKYGWSTVCQELITDLDARVICDQLGFLNDDSTSSSSSSSPAVVQCCDVYPKASVGTRKVLDSLNCTGSERMISKCPHPPPGHLDACSSTGHHDNDVGIRCRRCPAKSANIGAIVGGIIVVIVIIIVVAVLVYVCYVVPRRKYHKQVEGNEPDVEDHEEEERYTTNDPMVENDLNGDDLREKTAVDEDGEPEKMNLEEDSGV